MVKIGGREVKKRRYSRCACTYVGRISIAKSLHHTIKLCAVNDQPVSGDAHVCLQ